jgi:glycosyltransferase involved in cell wall biosynthesis
LAKLAGKSSLLGGREISVIPNPLDPGFFDAAPGPRVSPDQTGELVFVVIAANLGDPIKDVALAVECFSAARKKHPSIRLLLVGQGGQQFEGVPDVEVLGPLSTEAVISVLDSTDYLVIPSRAENSPSVAYEAASRGVIPLVRDAGGLPEVIENLAEGEIFSNKRDLTVLLESLASKPKLSSAQHKKLVSKVSSLCHPDTVATRYAELYEGQQ